MEETRDEVKNDAEIRMDMPEEDQEISGLFIWREFFREDAAAATMEFVTTLDNLAGVSDDPKSRRVAHFGYKYDYRKMQLPAKTVAIPEIFAAPTRPVAATLLGGSRMFDQLIINEYIPGQGISPHVDHPQQFGSVVFCICLGAGTNIVFSHPDGRVISRWLPAGSAYAMTGKSRNIWRHGIEAKKFDHVNGKRIARGTRYSLTYRTVLFPSE